MFFRHNNRVLGITGIYSYLFTNKSPIIIWFVIPIFVVFAWLSTINLSTIRQKKIDYIRDHLEKKIFNDPNLPGWETYYQKNSPSIYPTESLLWSFLLLVTVAAPVAFFALIGR